MDFCIFWYRYKKGRKKAGYSISIERIKVYDYHKENGNDIQVT